MLEITDKSGKTKFVIFDESTEPVSVDDLVIADSKKESGEEDVASQKSSKSPEA